jgi:hypothetical protein
LIRGRRRTIKTATLVKKRTVKKNYLIIGGRIKSEELLDILRCPQTSPDAGDDLIH